MPNPVLIVGAGPTGMTAALELSRMGIPVRLIEKAAAPPSDAPPPPERSRAIGIQARTLELLEMRGLAEEMLRLGHPTAGCSVYGGGRRLFHLDFSQIGSRHHYLLFLSQMETERILRDAIGKMGVAIERGVELVGFTQDPLSREPSPVKVVLRHPSGSLEQTQAPWLIDAEGAHSVVRTTLGLSFEGRTRDEAYALGDMQVDGDLSEDDFHLFSTEYGFLGLFPLGHRRFRIIAGVPPSMVREDASPAIEDLQAIFDERSPTPARFHDLHWASWFRINSRMVPHVRVGRVILGGDPAHIHSPAAGQGMNTGIQDMINLSWKLALVMQGQAPEACRAGRLRAGDRVPDLPVLSRVAHGADWQERSLFGLLDPSRFTLLVVHPGGSDADAGSVDWCDAVQPWPVIRVVGISAPSDDSSRARFHATFGRSRGVFLLRPDGYVAFLGGKSASGKHLAAYCRQWLTSRESAQAPAQQASPSA